MGAKAIKLGSWTNILYTVRTGMSVCSICTMKINVMEYICFVFLELQTKHFRMRDPCIECLKFFLNKIQTHKLSCLCLQLLNLLEAL